jgi:hypothetical protein
MLKRWTEQEKELVRLNYERLSYADLAAALGHTEGAVRNLCYRMCWRKAAPNWTEEELKQLLCHYEENDPPDLGELEKMFAGRHRTNICRKARELNLTRNGHSLSPEARDKIAQAVSDWHQENEHPRGFTGHQHTEAAKQIISQKSKEMWQDPNAIVNSDEYRQFCSDLMAQRQATRLVRSGYSRGSMGKREDLGGLFVRSSWEANYARYLNWLIEQNEIAAWEYEPDTFWFHEIKRGTRSYTPDFKVINNDGTVEYHEIKGWMDQKSRTALKRMAKYYPDVKLVVIDNDAYHALANDIKGFIQGWE